MPKHKTDPGRNLVVISDLHCGCRLALCPDEVRLADGGTYHASHFQRLLFQHWQEFFNEFVPEACDGEPWTLAINGELVDGVHHHATTPISHNLQDQRLIAEALLRPVAEQCEGRVYVLSGTPAHSGEQGVDDEVVATSIGARPDKDGRHARYELWIEVGEALVHLTHHVGTCGSSHYESSAPFKELVEAFIEAGRWKNRPPDFVVRSHRHRYIQVRIASASGIASAIVTPAWQGRTPFAYRIAGGRSAPPQFGGIVIRQHSRTGEVYTRERVWTLARPKAELVSV